LESTNEWAIKIAEIAAPDEIDLAPFVVEAFIEGGKKSRCNNSKSNNCIVRRT
jgi:hypothetical protein